MGERARFITTETEGNVKAQHLLCESRRKDQKRSSLRAYPKEMCNYKMMKTLMGYIDKRDSVFHLL